jgi:hypothetical protein
MISSAVKLNGAGELVMYAIITCSSTPELASLSRSPAAPLVRTLDGSGRSSSTILKPACEMSTEGAFVLAASRAACSSGASIVRTAFVIPAGRLAAAWFVAFALESALRQPLVNGSTVKHNPKLHFNNIRLFIRTFTNYASLRDLL